MLAPGGVRDAANPHPDSVRAFLPLSNLSPQALTYFMLGVLLSQGSNDDTLAAVRRSLP